MGNPCNWEVWIISGPRMSGKTFAAAQALQIMSNIIIFDNFDTDCLEAFRELLRQERDIIISGIDESAKIKVFEICTDLGVRVVETKAPEMDNPHLTEDVKEREKLSSLRRWFVEFEESFFNEFLAKHTKAT